MKNRRTPMTNDELLSGINALGQAMNTNFDIFDGRFDVILDIMEHFNPGSIDMYKKTMYRKQCYSTHLVLHQARTNGGVNALELINMHSEALRKLKKLGKDSGWQSAYNKAERDAAHFISEQEEPKPPTLEIIEP